MVSLAGKLAELSFTLSQSKSRSCSTADPALMASLEENNIVDANKDFDDPDNPLITKKAKFTKRQWRLLCVIVFINVCSSMCYSIQAPFYPKEAQKKGVSPSVYGMVFGVFELVDFILCPIYGKYIRQIGPAFMLNAGIFVMATCCILFGFLDKAPTKASFIALSFIVRIVEAMGQAGYLTASFAIIATEYTDNLAFAFTIAETSVAVGFILGPSVGGVLYEFGGFLMPFALNGGVLLIAAVATIFLLPKIEEAKPRSLSILKLLRIPSIAICYYAVFAVAFSFGFISVLFEPFLRSEFGMSTAIVGVVFVIPGASYAVTTCFWGILADKHVHPMLLCAIGGGIISVAFLIIGPVPFFHIKPTLWLVIVALILHGFGTGAEYIAAFINSNTEAIRHGFPENLETYGLISGLWTSGMALGSFIGPTASGFIGDAIGFGYGTLVVFGQQIIVIILALISYRYQKTHTIDNSEETKSLLQESQNIND